MEESEALLEVRQINEDLSCFGYILYLACLRACYLVERPHVQPP